MTVMMQSPAHGSGIKDREKLEQDINRFFERNGFAFELKDARSRAWRPVFRQELFL